MELDQVLEQLQGDVIEKIYMSEDMLIIQTNKRIASFNVEGDCCSYSVFYDFIGVKGLLGKTILSIEPVALEASDITEHTSEYGYDVYKDKKGEDENIEVYGYQINYLDPIYGERTAVFSFRNYSNGYYGGWMNGNIISKLPEKLPPLIKDDVFQT